MVPVRLYENNLSVIEQLLLAQTKHLKKQKSEKDIALQLETLMRFFGYGQDKFLLMGVFNEDSLVSMCGAYFHSHEPLWTMMFLTHKNELPQSDSLSKLLGCISELAELRGYFRFNYCCALRGLSVYDPANYSSLLTKVCPRLDRYRFYSVEIVNKGAFSKHSLHGEMLNNAAAESDLVFRCAELKEEFRGLIPV